MQCMTNAIPAGGGSSWAPDPVLENNIWEDIRRASSEGIASTLWAVGDTKPITINGQVGNTTFTNLEVLVFILGFNHNAALEGENLIHFQIGKIDTAPVALCDAKYSQSVSGPGYFSWNTSNITTGGWKSSYRRITLYGNNGAPTSPVSNSLMASLPADLLAVMQSVTKYTDNVANASGDVQSNVNATADYLFDLAEFELFGTRYGANTYEQNYQLQYDYYKAGNSKVAYKHSDVSASVGWDLRSVSSNFNYVISVWTNGSYMPALTSYSYGLRPCFVV